MRKLPILASQFEFYCKMKVFVYRISTNHLPVKVVKFILQDGEAVCSIGAL